MLHWQVFSRGAAFLILACDKMLLLSWEVPTFRECIEVLGQILTDVLGPNFHRPDNDVDHVAATMLGVAVAINQVPRAPWVGRARARVKSTLSSRFVLDLDSDSPTNMGTASRQPWSVYVKAHHSDDKRRLDNIFWVFKAGMVARSFQYILATDLLDDEPDLRELATAYISSSREVLWASLKRSYANAWEITTSPLSAETNSETQAWSVLGLLPPCALEFSSALPALDAQNSDWCTGSQPTLGPRTHSWRWIEFRDRSTLNAEGVPSARAH
mmetsp:Transcript_71989/g.142723  ORF Transcript_71989/g.142723 Transcript_71989/m.142723 type:complete len:271 (-) Transcript_71989:482-1294(-)